MVNCCAVVVCGPDLSPFLNKGVLLQSIAVMHILSSIGFVLLGIILVALFTAPLGRISAAIEKKMLKTFWWGILGVVSIVPVIAVLIVSILGIIFVPFWILLAAAAGVFGYYAAAHFLGKRILHAFRIRGQSMMVESLVGMLVLCLLCWVPIAGGIIQAAAAVCGLGGVIATRFGTKLA